MPQEMAKQGLFVRVNTRLKRSEKNNKLTGKKEDLLIVNVFPNSAIGILHTYNP